MIPGLENAEFSALRTDPSQHVHQCSLAADADAAIEDRDRAMFFAGQISGVEGYVESIATG